jgi:hypothetical protein
MGHSSVIVRENGDFIARETEFKKNWVRGGTHEKLIHW